MKKPFVAGLVLFAVGGSAACSIPPRPQSCSRFLACASYFDDVNGTDMSAGMAVLYGENGTCWQSAETEAACTTACEDATVELKDSLDAAGEDVGRCG